jgi:hypothetical protein
MLYFEAGLCKILKRFEMRDESLAPQYAEQGAGGGGVTCQIWMANSGLGSLAQQMRSVAQQSNRPSSCGMFREEATNVNRSYPSGLATEEYAPVSALFLAVAVVQKLGLRRRQCSKQCRRDDCCLSALRNDLRFMQDVGLSCGALYGGNIMMKLDTLKESIYCMYAR